MYSFIDYYAQFGILLNNTYYESIMPQRYQIYDEAICVLLFLLLLSAEIFIDIKEILRDSLIMKKITDQNDFNKRNLQDSSSTSIKTDSITNESTHE